MTTSQECLVFFLAALCFVHVATTSSDDFQPGYVSATLIGHQRLRVVVNYTATSAPDVKGTILFRGRDHPLRLRKHHADGQGRATAEISSESHMSLKFAIMLPKTIFTLTLEVPPTENRTEAIPDVHFEPEGDMVYAESGDVSVNVTVPAGVGAEGVSEETFSYTSYVKNDSFFYVSEDWPITMTEQPASGSGAVYRLDFNTSELRPEGVLLLKAYKAYSNQSSGLRLVRAVGVEQRVDFYQENHTRPVTPDTLALVKHWTDPADGSVQQCDLSRTPVCSASCVAIGPDLSEVNLEQYNYRWSQRSSPLDKTVTSSKMGFLTVTSGPVSDVNDRGEAWLKCEAKRGEDNSSVEVQRIDLLARRRPSILRRDSHAEFHTDVASMLVVCAATGLPLPNIVISDPDDTANTPLQERLPDLTYFRLIESDDKITARLWLSSWSYYHRSHVRCMADNGFKEPDVVTLDITIID